MALQAVSSSVGGLDDVYAVSRVAGSAFRRLGQVVAATAGPVTSDRQTYALEQGRLAARAAVDTAQTVMDTLYTLRDKLSAADGLSTPSQRPDLSRASLQAEIHSLVAGMDRQVAGSGVSGLNLLAEPGTTVQIRTSDLGGVASLVTQPLDSSSLGIAGLDVSSQDSTESSRISLEIAITQASVRYDTLSSAAQSLNYDSGLSPGLVEALRSLAGSDGSSRTLVRGSLVDMRA